MESESHVNSLGPNMNRQTITISPVARIPDSEASEVTISYLDKLSPSTQVAIKKLMGFGISVYIVKRIVTSPDVQYFLNKAATCLRKKKIPELGIPFLSQHDPKTNHLLWIPGKVRCFIWSLLPDKDLKNVRLLCKRFQFEIDRCVGVHGVIDSRCPVQFRWFKSVAIRSCTVNYLDDLSDLSWFARPKLLTSITLNDLCPITPKILHRILTICNNIRAFSAHFRDDGFSHDRTNKQILQVITNFQDQSQPTHVLALGVLAVTYIPAYRTCQWIMKFQRVADKIQIQKVQLGDVAGNDKKKKSVDASMFDMCPSTIKYLHLNFEHSMSDDGRSSSYSRHRFFWKNFLDRQINLSVIVCDFGPVCWEIYAHIIQQNIHTLKKIFFANVCCWDSWVINNGNSFDWNVFATCKQLTHLAIKAELGPRFGPRKFIPVSPSFPMQLKILHCDFGLVYWGFYASIVAANANTLEDVSLLRLTAWDKGHCIEHPFDWNIFSQCKALKGLEIGGENSIFLRMINFTSLAPPAGLKRFELHWVALSSQDVSHMIRVMPKLENTFEFLKFCTIDDAYQEESPQDIIQRLSSHPPEWITSLIRVMDVLAVVPFTEVAGTVWLYLN